MTIEPAAWVRAAIFHAPEGDCCGYIEDRYAYIEPMKEGFTWCLWRPEWMTVADVPAWSALQPLQPGTGSGA